MPIPRVTTTFDSSVAAPEREQFNDIVVFARAETEPTIGYNSPTRYNSPSDVADDIGQDSDAHVASQMLDTRGVYDWKVVVLEETETTEVLGDSASTSTTTGTTSTAPLAGNFLPTVSVDGTQQTTEAVTATPPGSNTTPDSGEAYVNMDTGEVVTGDSTSGTGAGIEVTYHTLSWAEAFSNVDHYSTDIAILADVRAGREHIGDLDQLVSWGVAEYITVPFAVQNGANFATQDEARQAGTEVAAYVSSGNTPGVAHRSSDDVGASVAGLMATEQTWADPSVNGRGFPSVSQPSSYDDVQVGDPETSGTFEGGASGSGWLSEGAGPLNVLHPTQTGSTLVLSNDLSTAGSGSTYQYVDVFRTEGLADHEVKSGLEGLLLETNVNFTETGRLQINNKVDEVLAEYEGDEGAYNDLEVTVPSVDALGSDQRGNRIWGPIGVQYRINGSVHRFTVNFSQTV